MPSPFPGMDPFIEGQVWTDFHATAIGVIRRLLAPQLEPNYVARSEYRVYLETDPGERDRYRDADVAVVEEHYGVGAATASSAMAIAPVETAIPTPQPRRESYLEVREAESGNEISIIEVLSPTKKRSGGDGRNYYLDKRDEIVSTRTNLIEINLLRSGLRLPTLKPLPPGDYFTVISKGYERPKAWVYAWGLEHRLPVVSIPLKRDDNEVSLDLQAVHDAVFDEGRYHISLKYHLPLDPPLTEAQAAWAAELLSSPRRQ